MVRLSGSCEGMQDRENQSPSVQNVFCSAFKENSYQQETKANKPFKSRCLGAAEGAGPSDSEVTEDLEETEGEGCGSQNCFGSK